MIIKKPQALKERKFINKILENKNFNIINWNIAGAKYFEEKQQNNRKQFRKKLNKALEKLIFDNIPHIITLQECVQYGVSKKRDLYNKENYVRYDIIDKERFSKGIKTKSGEIFCYDYYYFPLVDSCRFSAKDKWEKIKQGSDWPEDNYFSQGNGFFIRKDVAVHPVLDLSKKANINSKKVHMNNKELKRTKNYIEQINLETGLYLGNRDTERRAALVAHLVFNPEEIENNVKQKPLDIFVINIHLTTFVLEKEGLSSIEQDTLTKYRLSQLEIIFNGIISRYNEWKKHNYSNRGKKKEIDIKIETLTRSEPLWIVAGDFNFTPLSREYQFIETNNFLNLHPSGISKPTKALKYGKKPTIILDYIFIGPKHIADNPLFYPSDTKKNRVYNWKEKDIRGISDHYPLFASIPIKEAIIADRK